MGSGIDTPHNQSKASFFPNILFLGALVIPLLLVLQTYLKLDNSEKDCGYKNSNLVYNFKLNAPHILIRESIKNNNYYIDRIYPLNISKLYSDYYLASETIENKMTTTASLDKTPLTSDPLSPEVKDGLNKNKPISPVPKVNENDPSFSKVFNVFEDITKPAQDKRDYRLLTLSNKLRVLLISDPVTDKASAAADIHVGSLSDPDDIPGLAHFLEHLLFMGTEKYPVENDYSQYLSAHGGMSNAYTAEEHTNYYFEVTANNLEGALDRFAQFFIAPLFSESGTEREMNAVDSEHKKNLQSDSWRVFQLEKQLSNPNHVYRKFGTGNLETLGVNATEKGYDIRTKLIDFHSKLYSSNIMTVVILGKEPLEILTNWAVDKFSFVLNKDIDFPRFSGKPLTEKELGVFINIKPVKDIRHLEISFPIPETRKWYKYQPCHYLSHLLGHEGKGSVLSLLKKKGWALGLSAGSLDSSDNFDFFKISIDLTKEGVSNYESIIEIVFSYIEIIKKDGLQEWIFKEIRQLENINFRFKEKSGAAHYSSSLANAMHHYSDKDILSGPYLMETYDVEKINFILKELNPKNFRVSFVNSDFEPNEEWKKGDWYETPYKIIPFTEEFKTKLANVRWDTIEGLVIPLKNPFVPDNLDVQIQPDDKTDKPTILKNNEFVRLWHKKDNKFLVPKAHVFMVIHSPLAYSSPKNFVLTSIYSDLVQDALNEISYDASCAGLHYSLGRSTSGLTLAFEGYNDKLSTLLEKIVDKMKNLKVNEDRFKFIYEQTERSFRNWYMESPVNHAISYGTYLTQEVLWLQVDKLKALKLITAQDVQDFYPTLLERTFIEAFVHGNVNTTEALDLVAIVEKNISIDSLTPFERIRTMRSHIPPENVKVIQFYDVPNPDNLNSAIDFVLYIGYLSDDTLYAHGNLLAQISSEPIFDQLRTREQLGYMVFSGLRKQGETFGFRVIVQSEKDPVFLESRIENMLISLRESIENMTNEAFEKHKAALVVKVLEKEKNLAEASQHMWSHISTKRYDFDLKYYHSESIKKITKETLLQFFDEYIKKEAAKRRKISTLLRSQKNTTAVEPEIIKSILEEEGTLIINSETAPQIKLAWELSRGPIPQTDISSFLGEGVV